MYSKIKGGFIIWYTHIKTPIYKSSTVIQYTLQVTEESQFTLLVC